MPFGFRIVVAVLLFVGASVSGGELQVNGFPTDANFFPIGVWLQSPTRAASYKAIGINTFVGLYEGPTEEQLAALARQHMFAVAGQNDVALKSVNRHVIKAWMQEDEPDNAQPIGPGLYGTCIPAIEVARRTQEMKARDPTRPMMINFGQGVATNSGAVVAPATVIRDTTILRSKVQISCRTTSIRWDPLRLKLKEGWNTLRVASPISRRGLPMGKAYGWRSRRRH